MFNTFCSRFLSFFILLFLFVACSEKKEVNNEGQALIDKKEYQKALEWYNQKIEDEKDVTVLKDLYYKRATVHHKMAKFDLAMNDINWALVIDSVNTVYLGEKGDLFYAKHMMTDAQNQYQRALAIEPKEGKWLYKTGVCRLMTNETEKALEDLEKAESMGFNDSDLYLQLGHAYQRTNQQEKCCAAFKKSASMGNVEAKEFVKNLGCQP